MGRGQQDRGFWWGGGGSEVFGQIVRQARSGQTLDPHRLRPPKQSNQIPKKVPNGLSRITNTPRVVALRLRRLFSCERYPLSVLFLQQAHRISSFSPLTSVCVWFFLSPLSVGFVCEPAKFPLAQLFHFSLVESRFRGRLG